MSEREMLQRKIVALTAEMNEAIDANRLGTLGIPVPLPWRAYVLGVLSLYVNIVGEACIPAFLAFPFVRLCVITARPYLLFVAAAFLIFAVWRTLRWATFRTTRLRRFTAAQEILTRLETEKQLLLEQIRTLDEK